MTDTLPYGSWPSPLDAETVAAGSIDFGHVALDGETAYWLERRPAEDGRGVVVRQDTDEGPADVTPADVDVRTLVHEYGGGDFAVRDGTVVYARFTDQRLYRIDVESDGENDPTPLTPESPEERSARYADFEFAPDGSCLYCVRERHHGEDATEEAVAELVRVSLADDAGEPAAPEVVASGHDFYSFPRPSPAGDRLAWTTWDHPNMPWDGTELRVADVDPDGSLSGVETVAGGPDESVFQPTWSPDGDLYAVSDRSGWWNLYRVAGGSADGDVAERLAPVREEHAEYGVPQWVFGLSTYAFLADGRIAAVRRDGDTQDLGLLDPETGTFEVRDEVAEVGGVFPHTRLRADGDTLLAVVGGPADPASVVRWSPGESPTVLRRAHTLDVDDASLPDPETVTFPTGPAGDERAHAYFYPPRNPAATGPGDERPPLVTMVHGGPTSRTDPVLDLTVAYLTSRGFAVADVNYRGSTGYGRAYRDRLDGEWGVVDVEDCVNLARYLAEEGLVDSDRRAIRGATLAALAFHDTYEAGASRYGVADLRALAEHTHTFESRYLDGLVGPLPEAESVYEARSPAAHADGIEAPLLVLQGGEDRVVPPAQADDMVRALVADDVPYAYVEFAEERHGFRRSEARRRALETELGFYAAVFDLDPADVEPLALDRGTYEKRSVSVEDE